MTAQDRSRCIIDCKTARDTRPAVGAVVRILRILPGITNANDEYYIGCAINCPCAEDKATNEVIDDFDNDTNEGARLRDHPIKPAVADNVGLLGKVCAVR